MQADTKEGAASGKPLKEVFAPRCIAGGAALYRGRFADVVEGAPAPVAQALEALGEPLQSALDAVLAGSDYLHALARRDRQACWPRWKARPPNGSRRCMRRPAWRCARLPT